MTTRPLGEIVQLQGDRIANFNEVAVVAADKMALGRMMDKILNKDVDGFFDVVKAEQGTLIPAGTRAKILKYDSIGRSKIVQIEVLEGDLAGRSVWTHQFFIP